MSIDSFPYIVYGYYRFHSSLRAPVIAKMIITNQFPMAIKILLNLSRDAKIRTIQIHYNKTQILSVTRKKGGWISDI